MGDRKFTFIELHLDGETQFGPKDIRDALPGGRKVEVDAETETEDDEAATSADEDDSGKGAVGVVVGVLLLVGFAVAFKKLRSGDETPIEEYDEPDVIVN